MPTRPRLLASFILLFTLTLVPVCAPSQEMNPALFSGLRWRLIGPFRGGRVTCVAGVPQQPNTYYFGTPNGGIWKTADGGQVWQPVFDEEHVASIGAIAVAPSNPNIIYAGTGEQVPGNGVYKSTDAGVTWKNVGLQETHIITSIAIDPRNPDLVVVATSGDVASGDNRGIYRSRDGGANWQKVLFKDKETRVVDMNMSPDRPKVLYAALLRAPGGPPAGASQQPATQNAAIYKSTDEGATWSAIAGKGLPGEPMGRVGVAVIPGSQGNKVFAIVSQGLFRSDDGGQSWVQTTTDPRIVGNGYFSRIFVDPRNPDVVYVAQTSMYRSTDGGKTFEAFTGAPSGDDFHVVWINPLHNQDMIFGVDQGAIITVDGGKTWSSWYNQPTGQFYHVITDNRFPYYVYAAQQDSGTAAVASRSDYGEITERNWAPTGGFEVSYIAPDPFPSSYVYLDGWYGSILRYDRNTGQVVHLLARSSKYRTTSSPPVVFSPRDAHTLYAAAQYVLKTTDGGFTWQEISPDLTQRADAQAAEPSSTGRIPPAAISVLAVSTVQAGEIWAGTNNGLVQVTRDGATWENATPSGLPARVTVRALEASTHDRAKAYAVFSRMMDSHPLIYRTRDFGKTWQAITSGLPDSVPAYVVREDPVRYGLLYAGTANAVYVSFDDGDHWQSLQLNLPTTTVTDLTIHRHDLVASTYGRALWILDDITPLWLLQPGVANEEAHLFGPAIATRVRWDMNQDTPLPSEVPAGKNPPDGAIIDFYLKSPPAGDLKLTIYDRHNNIVRAFSSATPAADSTFANVPSYWFAPPPQLSKSAGLNRFVWDLRYPEPKTLRYSYYGNPLNYVEYTLADHAIPGETPRQQPLGPLVTPGSYTVELRAAGKIYRQELTVELDPRIHLQGEELRQQLEVAKSITGQMAITYDSANRLEELRAAMAERQKSLAGNSQAKDAAEALKALDSKIDAIEIGTRVELGLGPLNRELARLVVMVESGDARPAESLRSTVEEYCGQLQKRLGQWRENNATIAQANSLLQKYNLAPLPIAATIPDNPVCGK